MKLAVLILTLSVNVSAQTYVITNPQGYVTGTVQVQGNQAQIIDNRGFVQNSLTIYPNQIVTPQGYAVGTPSYTVPPNPPSPPSPRVLQ
jgi:hypothetical protein